MTDLKDLLEHAAGAEPAVTDHDLAADLSRGRRRDPPPARCGCRRGRGRHGPGRRCRLGRAAGSPPVVRAGSVGRDDHRRPDGYLVAGRL
jgi:hypothetical protein